MADERPRGAIRTLSPAKGLHVLKNEFQKKYLREQCEFLLAHLDEAIHHTFRLAPVRNRPYLVDHANARRPEHPEGQLERALHAQWAGECEPAVGCWERLVAFQVNLPNERGDQGWGEIDLLGMSTTRLPVVVELKQGNATDTPAANLCQGVAYALVLQKAWPTFRNEWRAHLRERFSLDPVLPTALHPVTIVCAAPSNYWDEWVGNTPRAATVTPESWAAVRRLVGAFAARGLSTTFARIDKLNGRFETAIVTLPCHGAESGHTGARE
jgi:hypothetical protein